LEGGKLDVAALKLLMRSAGMWLEVLALRKTTTGSQQSAESALAPAPPVVVSAPVTQERAASVIASAAAEAATATVRAVAVGSPSEWTPEEREIHTRAQRFARLLVDEIKLYNQSQVAEGCAHHDLYDRLKDDIEKSRASYNKRYGNSPAASADYFSKELVRILADNDVSLLGANFPG
jgi:hypothetical protein